MTYVVFGFMDPHLTLFYFFEHLFQAILYHFLRKKFIFVFVHPIEYFNDSKRFLVSLALVRVLSVA